MHFYFALIGIFHYYLNKKHYTRGSTFAIADVCYDYTFRKKMEDDDESVPFKIIWTTSDYLQLFKP